MRNAGLKSLIAVTLIAAAGAAGAATTTTTFNVTATVANNCRFSSAGNMAFGTYDPLSGTALDQTSTITYNCTKNTPYTLALSAGTGTGATFAVRKMTNGANTLNYSLFTDAARTTVWGDGTGGSSTMAAPAANGLLANLNVTVYGRIPLGQDVAAVVYTDTITATLTF